MENCTLQSILEKHLSLKDLEFVDKLLYGPNIPKNLQFDIPSSNTNRKMEDEIKTMGFSFIQEKDPLCRRTRVGIFQNSIVRDTTLSVAQQKESLLELGTRAIRHAAHYDVNIFCFQELWNMPMGICTQKKLPWVEFAENCFEGLTTQRLKVLAKECNMVIVSPILERDDKEDCLWNSAIVINNCGVVLGVTRKNHIPISGRFSESYYYNPSGLGHPVFQTDFGKIAVSICYERHHPQSWLAYGINGAEIVFNPSATIQSFSESLWPIETRDAAIKNQFYTCAINRVGVEYFDDVDGSKIKAGPFFGSSYITAPDGSRTPSQSVTENSLLIADLDLNQCCKKTPGEKLAGFDRSINKCLDSLL